METPYEQIKNLTFSCAYWNKALQKATAVFRDASPEITTNVLLTDSFFDSALDDPHLYGATDNTCKNRDGKSCLFVDGLHPGMEIARLVGRGVYEHLDEIGFYS